jgi:hypothetical protein
MSDEEIQVWVEFYVCGNFSRKVNQKIPDLHNFSWQVHVY